MKEKRDNYSVKDVKSNYHVDTVGKEVTPETRRKLNASISESRKKELEIINAFGPSSTPERHYPKSFIIKLKE